MHLTTRCIALVGGLGLAAMLGLATSTPVAYAGGAAGLFAAPAPLEQATVLTSTMSGITLTVPGVTLTVEMKPAIVTAWEGSAHADLTAPAFTNWDDQANGLIPSNCAKCHSTPGYLDFVGADGSEPGVVNHTQPIGSGVECIACHNEAADQLSVIAFPSGVEVHPLATEANCLACHQGRNATGTVDNAIERASTKKTTADKVIELARWPNIHGGAAAATQYGTQVQGGYQYAGKLYDWRFDHVEDYATCTQCHNAHTLAVNVDDCATCHKNVRTAADLVNIRTEFSALDYDGDGNTKAGIAAEIDTVRELLYTAIQRYGQEILDTQIVYSPSSPYFFVEPAAESASSSTAAATPAPEADVQPAKPIAFDQWTPRLVRAAYNYNLAMQDEGAYAHNAKYVIQLLYDSIEDLNSVLTAPVDLSGLTRNGQGHFDGASLAFRNWDAAGEVPENCSKCHSATGLPQFLAGAAAHTAEPSNGLACTTCHDNVEKATVYAVTEVAYPSKAVLSLTRVNRRTGRTSNLCMECHQGRSAGNLLAQTIGDRPDGVVDPALSFTGIHHGPAAATLFGAEAGGGYEYAGNRYGGRYAHARDANTCLDCHNGHTGEVTVSSCAACHRGVTSLADLATIRQTRADHDGNGNSTEGIAVEIEALRNILFTTMQAYAQQHEDVDQINYDPARFPFFFTDAGEAYTTWTPELLRAAYNYDYAMSDPAAYVHNPTYMIQLLYDSIATLGRDTARLTRPS
jgi:hypothetical protein